MDPKLNEKEENRGYKPNKAQREARRIVWERYNDMMADGLRQQAEAQWDMADKQFRQYIAPRNPDDWRSHLVLPDAFSAIQTQAQETIERKSRPLLKQVEDSDQGKEDFANAIMKFSMDRTGFDFQYYQAKLSASARGTAFLYDYYRVDKRRIKDPTGVNEGVLTYTEKEVIDFDDDYTEWIPNEYIFIDPAAKHIDEARDMIRREILDVKEFKRIYGFREDFEDVNLVCAGGDTLNRAFFKMPRDLNANDVEVLHYHDRANDRYWVLANNVLVRLGPIPNKHKELPVAVIYQYMIPGQFWGMGIPQIINALTEERKSIRNLNMDRQKMQLNKMFLKNDAFDLDEEETVTRPFGIINVNSNGQPLNQVMQPIEYGDVPASYFRTEEILLQDERRATGIEDRLEASASDTATGASIKKESILKRINMISMIAEMDGVKRIGKLKWSNIQFFYPAPKVEKIVEEDNEKERKVYKKIKAEGKSFTVVKGPKGNELVMNEVEGTTTFTLNRAMARFMEGDYDIVVDADSGMVISKPLQQAKITEMFTLIMSNPALANVIDPKKSTTRLLEVNEETPKDWLKGTGRSDADMQILAEQENVVMANGTPLAPTDGANEQHTLVHLYYTKTVEYQNLPEHIKMLFGAHVTGENEANPMTANMGSLSPQKSGAPVGLPGQGLPPGNLPAPSMSPGDVNPAATIGGPAPNTGPDQNVAVQ